MKKILISFLFLSGLTACSFLKIENGLYALRQEPFDLTVDQQKKAHKDLSWLVKMHSSKAISWWISYKKALLLKDKNPESSCEYMYFLSRVKKFPLRDYARLYMYTHCDSELDIDLASYPVFLQKNAAEQWHKKAKKLKQDEAIMESAYQLYKTHSLKDEKEQYLLKAIGLAKKNKIPSSQLQEWKKELYTLSPRFIPKPSHSQKLAVAEDLRRNREWDRAKIYYRQLLNHPKTTFTDKSESFKQIRKVYRLEKNNQKYLTATRQWKHFLKRKMKKNKKARQSYHDISLLLAQTQWTLNKPYKALKTLKTMETELKNKISFFKIYRLKAHIFSELNKYNKAILFFQKALKEPPPPNTEDIDKTKWQYAWILKKTNKIKPSLSVFQDLLKTTESDYLPSRILFWMADLYENTQQPIKANNTYQELIQKDPLSYYGLLAHYKTKKPIQLNKQKDIYDILKNNTSYIIPYWLLSLGKTSAALNVLNHKLKTLQEGKFFTEEEKGILFYYMAKARSYLPLFRMIGSLPLKERSLFFQSYTSLLFPMDYKKEIQKASQIFDVEKELIYALIRQESAYNPRARSPADAFGLMQLRPFVAKKTAKKHGIRYKNRHDLYQPEKNILLGTAFLKNLFKRYNSQFVTTLAVYNAGDTAVRRWLQRHQMDNPLSFIEEIPYEETKTYVRLLIRNFIFYKLLHSDEHSINFPEWLLHIKKQKQ